MKFDTFLIPAARGSRLALALALISSRDEKPVHRQTAAFGEIGLGGEIRPVTGTEIRLKELERLGFKKCILPAGSASKEIQSNTRLELVGLESVSRLRDAL